MRGDPRARSRMAVARATTESRRVGLVREAIRAALSVTIAPRASAVWAAVCRVTGHVGAMPSVRTESPRFGGDSHYCREQQAVEVDTTYRCADVLAHELAHHVQFLRGELPPGVPAYRRDDGTCDWQEWDRTPHEIVANAVARKTLAILARERRYFPAGEIRHN